MTASIEQTRSTVHTVAVAAELVGAVITKIAGNDISNRLNDSPLTRALVSNVATSHILSTLKVAG